MTILQVAGEDESFDLLNASVSTNTNTFRTTYARCSIHSGGEDGVQVIFRSALKPYLDAQPSGDKDFWFGYRFVGGGGFLSGGIGLKLYDTSDKVFMRLINPSSGDLKLQTSDDGSFAGIHLTDYPASTTTQSAPAGNPHEWTFRVKIHPTLGHIAWYINGSMWYMTSVGDTTGLCSGSPKLLRFGSPNSNGDGFYSEFIATSADHPRVGLSLNTIVATADGALAQWVGGFGAISEITENTSTLLQTAAAANDSTFIASDMVPLAGQIVVLAVILSGKFAAAVGAPQNVAGLLRISGVNYSAALQTVAATNELRQFIWATSPATSTRFLEAEVNGLQYGIRSAA